MGRVKSATRLCWGAFCILVMALPVLLYVAVALGVWYVRGKKGYPFRKRSVVWRNR